MADTIRDEDWDLLLDRIKNGQCTPFIGAGASYGTLPLGSEIAKRWADENKYPFKSSNTDLARVSQFLAIVKDGLYPKEKIVEEFKQKQHPDFSDPENPHALLADFPLPIYVTTNYDSFLSDALIDRNRNPKLEICRWNQAIKNKIKKSIFDDRHYVPSKENPVVYHLHGHLDYLESLVLTEDDYLDFLINISGNARIIPNAIQEAFATSSLLFIGYKLADVNFRVLLRSIGGRFGNNQKRSGISVQLVSLEEIISEKQKEKAQEYLNQYFQELKLKVFWGTAADFTKELRKRWEELNGK